MLLDELYEQGGSAKWSNMAADKMVVYLKVVKQVATKRLIP